MVEDMGKIKEENFEEQEDYSPSKMYKKIRKKPQIGLHGEFRKSRSQTFDGDT